MNIGEICTREVVTITVDDDVLAAATKMREHHVGDVVVLNPDVKGQLPVGMLTDRDVVVSLVDNGTERLSDITVRKVMSDVVVLARDEDDIDDVLANMVSNGIRRVPVVDRHDALQGIVALDDIIRHYGGQLASIDQLVREETRKESKNVT